MLRRLSSLQAFVCINFCWCKHYSLTDFSNNWLACDSSSVTDSFFYNELTQRMFWKLSSGCWCWCHAWYGVIMNHEHVSPDIGSPTLRFTHVIFTSHLYCHVMTCRVCRRREKQPICKYIALSKWSWMSVVGAPS